jgi:hypothetical protein
MRRRAEGCHDQARIVAFLRATGHSYEVAVETEGVKLHLAIVPARIERVEVGASTFGRPSAFSA